MDIKKVLHHYIGSKVQFRCSEWEPHVWSPPVELTSKMYMDLLNDPEIDTIQLILKPLTSMKPEENDEVLDLLLKRTPKNSHHHLVLHAQAAAYLSSKHYDVYGLIEAGVAVDVAKFSQKIYSE